MMVQKLLLALWCLTARALLPSSPLVSLRSPKTNVMRREATPSLEDVVSTLPNTLIAASRNADLPDPRNAVIFLGFLAVAFLFTQLSFFGVVRHSWRTCHLLAGSGRGPRGRRVGPQGTRVFLAVEATFSSQAREQMARRRGYFRNKQ